MSPALPQRPAGEETHRQRQDAAIVATTELLASKAFNEILTAEEERGLATALPTLWEFAEVIGVVNKPLSAWSKQDVMRFLALAVRAAVPLRTLPDHQAFREFSDAVPF